MKAIDKILNQKNLNLVEALEAERKRQLSIPNNDESIRLANLLEQYQQFALIDVEKCDESSLSNRMFIVKLHSHQPKSSSFKFVHDKTVEQIELCLPVWGSKLDASLRTLSKSLQSFLKEFITRLVLVTRNRSDNSLSGKHEPVHRPWSANQLARTLMNPPAAGILLLLNDYWPQKLELDENMKNHKLPRQEFDALIKRTIASFCANICEQLNPETSIYSYAFSRDLDSSKFLSKLVENLRLEAIVGHSICCKLSKLDTVDAKFNQVYNEIVSPNVYQEDAKADLTDELIAKEFAKMF